MIPINETTLHEVLNEIYVKMIKPFFRIVN